MADMSGVQTIWVFTGPRAHFPSGVFTTLETAELWIQRHGLTGTLTQYPVDEGAYDWAIRENLFEASKPEHRSAGFISRFSAANQEHYHYEDGTRD